MKIVSPIKAIKNSAVKAWYGEERLWKVFWLWDVFLLIFGIFISRSIIGIVDKYFSDRTIGYTAIFLFDIVLMMAIRILQIIVTWKCSKNVFYRSYTIVVRTLIILFLIISVYGSMKTAHHIIKTTPNVINK